MSLNRELADEIVAFIKTKDPNIKVVDVMVAITMVLTTVAVEAGVPLNHVQVAVDKAYKHIKSLYEDLGEEQ